MKKILAFALAVLMLCSVGAVSASAKMNLGGDKTLLYLKDEIITYNLISYNHSEDVRTYDFSTWVEKMGYLEDLADYTEEYEQWLIAQYRNYVEGQREKLLKEGEAFFEKYFDRGTDELVCNSDRRAMVLVKSTVGKAKSLRDKDDCNLFFGHNKEDYSLSYFDKNNYSYLIPSDEDISNIQPYELIYALHYYESHKPLEYWDALYTEWTQYMYKMLYRHFDSSLDEATAEEASPDYVLVFGGENVMSPAYSAAGFGDKYLVQEYNIYYPYILGFYVITTDDMKVHTLREAWNAQIDGIEDIFTDFGLGEIRGDSDNDGKITVKDATHLQKCLAGIERFTEDEYVSGFGEAGQRDDEGMFSDRVSDMNMDGSVNIKDATAIQKFLAGIEYR